LEELNIFQGSRSDEGDRFRLFDFVIRTYSKVVKHQSKEIGIQQWSRTLNGADLGHGSKDITGKRNGFTSHEVANECKGFGVDGICRIGLVQNSMNKNIIK